MARTPEGSALTDTEALSLPAQYQLHPFYWVFKAYEFYVNHEYGFKALGWGILAAGVWAILASSIVYFIHKFKHRDPPE